MKNCYRVQLPEPRSNKEECELSTRDTLTQQEVKKYIEEMEKKEAEALNMTKSEVRGLKKLRKKNKGRRDSNSKNR